MNTSPQPNRNIRSAGACRARPSTSAIRALSALLLFFAVTLESANVRLYFLNRYTGSLDTNAFIVTPISGNILASGGVIPQGLPIRVTPATNGCATNFLSVGFYALTNRSLNYANGVVINVYDQGSQLYDYTNLLHSGFNTYVGGSASGASATNVTQQAVTNALGFLPLTPAQTTNAANHLIGLSNANFLTATQGTNIAAFQAKIATNDLNTALVAGDTTVSNGLSTRLLNTNTALIAADTIVSNGLSARLIATNDALVTLIASSDTTVSNGLSTRLLNTNTALLAATASASNVVHTALISTNSIIRIEANTRFGWLSGTNEWTGTNIIGTSGRIRTRDSSVGLLDVFGDDGSAGLIFGDAGALSVKLRGLNVQAPDQASLAFAGSVPTRSLGDARWQKGSAGLSNVSFNALTTNFIAQPNNSDVVFGWDGTFNTLTNYRFGGGITFDQATHTLVVSAGSATNVFLRTGGLPSGITTNALSDWTLSYIALNGGVGTNSSLTNFISLIGTQVVASTVQNHSNATLTIKTVDAVNATPSTITIAAGANSGTNGNAGGISIASGSITIPMDTTTSKTSGPVSITTGTSGNGGSGSFFNTNGASGDINITTGSASRGRAGDITIQPGLGDGQLFYGNVFIGRSVLALSTNWLRADTIAQGRLSVGANTFSHTNQFTVSTPFATNAMSVNTNGNLAVSNNQTNAAVLSAPIVVSATNTVMSALTFNTNLNWGTFPLANYNTNFVTLWGAATNGLDGTYHYSGGRYTNVAGNGFIVTNITAVWYVKNSGGIIMQSSPSLVSNGWTVVNGGSPAAASALTGYIYANGIPIYGYLNSTSMTAQISAIVASSNVAAQTPISGDVNGAGYSGTNWGALTATNMAATNVTAVTVTAGSLFGNGSGITSLNAAALTGSISDSRLSSNVPLENSANTFTKTNVFNALAVTNMNQGAATVAVGWNAATKQLTTNSVPGGSSLSSGTNFIVSGGAGNVSRDLTNMQSITTGSFTNAGGFSSAGDGQFYFYDDSNVLRGTINSVDGAMSLSYYIATFDCVNSAAGFFDSVANAWLAHDGDDALAVRNSDKSAYNYLRGTMALESDNEFATKGYVDTAVSDARLKTNFRAVNNEDVLKRLLSVPVQQWNWKDKLFPHSRVTGHTDVIRSVTNAAGKVEKQKVRLPITERWTNTVHDPKPYLGVTAQDWQKAFPELGNGTNINRLDQFGVAVAAIQALAAKVEALEKRVKQLESR